ncbi:MAG: hypothetical protein GY940_45465 [bacterium]|nr:hypothetical protein [bacterium]
MPVLSIKCPILNNEFMRENVEGGFATGEVLIRVSDKDDEISGVVCPSLGEGGICIEKYEETGQLADGFEDGTCIYKKGWR